MNGTRCIRLRMASAAMLLVGIASTAIVFAKDGLPGDDAYGASGDSVGTLPVVAGTGGGGWEEYAQGQLTRQTALTVTLPANQVRNVVSQAFGTGHVEWSETGVPGQAQLRFVGSVQLVLEESALESGLVHLELGTQSPYTWHYAVQHGAWQSAARAVSFMDRIPLDAVPSLLARRSALPLRVLTVVRPGVRSAITFTRGAGVVFIEQGSF